MKKFLKSGKRIRKQVQEIFLKEQKVKEKEYRTETKSQRERKQD